MLVLVWFYVMVAYLMLWVLEKSAKTLFGCESLVVHPRTVENPGIFAQARALGVSPWSLRELSLRRRAPVLSEIHLAQARRSRLSERTRMLHVPLFELSPKRRELAWARETSRLSETFLPERGARRESVLLCFSSVLGCMPLVWFGLVC